jgi:putative sterol carrier protein
MGEDKVKFGSDEWLDAYAKLWEANDELVEFLKEFNATIAYKYLDRPDIAPKYVRLEKGHIVEYGPMPEEKDMDYVLIANYDVWKALAFGELDPVKALMNRKMRVTGNLSAIMKVAPGFALTLSIVQSIPTDFD